MMRVATTSLGIALLLASATFAAPPRLHELRPWGAQRGRTVTLSLMGDGLGPGTEVFSAVPGRLEEQPCVESGELKYQLEIRSDAPVGVYPIRVRTAAGLSNDLLFSVGDLPEIAEIEPNDSFPSTASVNSGEGPTVPLSHGLPITVNGSAVGTDQDFLRVAGSRGQRLVAEVEAQRIGSLLDPAVHLFTADGRHLALADDTPGLGADCRVDVILPDDGEYVVCVRDSKYAGAPRGQYRLKIGSFVYAENVFPLGWQRGREVEISLFGRALSQPVETRRMVANARQGLSCMFVPSTDQGLQGLLPFRFVLGEEPELMESELGPERWFKDGAVMNGRIDHTGEVDRYRFPVKPGEAWIFELNAASLGSRLDGFLTVTAPDGKVLASTDDGNGLDPWLQVKIPDGLDHVVLAAEDLHGRAGAAFAYRLTARPVPSDFTLHVLQPEVNVPRSGTAVVQVKVSRSGYAGPIELTIPETLTGITAEESLIAAGANEGFLMVTACGDASLRAFDLDITGHGGSPAKPIRRPGSSGGRSPYAMADAFVARVPAAVCEPLPVALTPVERTIRVVHGGNHILRITAQRGPTATEAIAINATTPARPVTNPIFNEGFTGTIPKESIEVAAPGGGLNLGCTPYDINAVGTFMLLLSAKTKIDGREETFQLAPVRVEVLRPFAIEVLSKKIRVPVGGKTLIAVIVRREAPLFDGLVKVGPGSNLPQHVSLSTVEVLKDESLALLELAAGEMSATEEFDLQIRASTSMKRKFDGDYHVPDATVRIEISPKAGEVDP